MSQNNCHTVAANTVRRYIGIHDFHHIKTYVFKQSHSSSGRPMNAPTNKQQLSYKKTVGKTLVCIIANCLPDLNFPFSIFHFQFTNLRSGNLTLAFVKLSSQTENGGSPSILIRITLHDSDNILLHNRCVGYGNA